MQKSWVGEGPAPSGCLIRLTLLHQVCQSSSVLLAGQMCSWSCSVHPTGNWHMAWRCLSPAFLFFSIRQYAKENQQIYLCIDTCTGIVPTTLIIIKHPTSFLSYRNFKLMFICLVLIFNVSGKINDTDTLTGIIAWKLSACCSMSTLREKRCLRNYEPRFCFLKIQAPEPPG